MKKKAISMSGFNAYYGSHHVLKNINMTLSQNKIIAFIGPSGCGKTTLIKSINRLNDMHSHFKTSGELSVFENNVYALKKKEAIEEHRRHVGMVFQHPNLLPMSILKNVCLPIEEHYKVTKEHAESLAIEMIKKTSIYEEVKDRLHKPALSLSGGQQQRLCIARSMMLKPKVLLLDEPCSALDPYATSAIEEMLIQLKKDCTIVIVTHNMEQAMRISDNTAFFYNGELIEQGVTDEIMVFPQTTLLEQYITRRI